MRQIYISSRWKVTQGWLKMLHWNKLQANTRGIGISYKHAGHFQETHEVRCGCSKLQERHRVSLPPALRQQILQAEGSSQNEIHVFWYFLGTHPWLYDPLPGLFKSAWLVTCGKFQTRLDKKPPKAKGELEVMDVDWNFCNAWTMGSRQASDSDGKPQPLRLFCAWSSAVQRLSFTCLSSSSSCSCFTWAKRRCCGKY